GFSYVKLRLGLPNLLLPFTTRSAAAPPRIAPELRDRIREDYAADYAFLERHANRERTADGLVPIFRAVAPPGERTAPAAEATGR
ncbi:MAG: hypothetical protein R3263_12030, partial [Myxococcota bacterium]|nr:hypothetical protein [Myxococcota bacterium]